MNNSMPQTLTPELRDIAVAALNAYLHAPPTPDGRTVVKIEDDSDQRRVSVIEDKLQPLLANYLTSSISATDFKRQINGINLQNPLWGFGGIKGQMFFNMLVKTAPDISEFDKELQYTIREPANEEEADSQLNAFRSYVTRIGQQFVDAGGEPRGRPKPSSIPFFVSYFWQIQRRDVWPIYYTSTVQTIEGINLWEATGEISKDYLTFKRLHERLIDIFSEVAGRPFSLYDVEHVFWFKSGKLFEGITQTPSPTKNDTSGEANRVSAQISHAEPTQASVPPDSYVPPIVAVIPKLALNDSELREAAVRSGTTLERAFEKSINAAFTVMGYETELLGQGKGRVPDGQAIAVNESYAILWDAKARTDGYRMGTDDRVIRQYIESQSRILRRGHRIRNVYYLIVSSSFSDDFEDLIGSLKMETDVSEVCLVEATALVAIVDQKLRAPLGVGLGSDGIQRLFSSSGIVTAADVQENLA